MRVFLSWSGDTSRELAQVFSEWIPSVLQAVHTYFTPDDIDKGKRWPIEISNELDNCDLGLLFMTRDNLEASWIMFEAGALSKKLETARVSPLLFGVGATDLKGPLAHFQATNFSKDEILKLMQSLNNGLSTGALPINVLSSTFEKWWPDLEAKVAGIMKLQGKATKQIRTDRDILEEILQTVRGLTPTKDPNGELLEQLRENVKNLVNLQSKNQDLHATSNLEHHQICSLTDVINFWPQVIDYAKERIGGSAAAYLSTATPVAMDDKDLVLYFGKQFHYEKATEASKRLPFEKTINELLDKPRALRFIR